MIHVGRVPQANPELTDMTSLTRHIFLGTHCLYLSWLKLSSTWDMGIWTLDLQSKNKPMAHTLNSTNYFWFSQSLFFKHRFLWPVRLSGQWFSYPFLSRAELQKLPLCKLSYLFQLFHLRNRNLKSGPHECTETTLPTEAQNPKHTI